jgi:putative RNA 2'-phosphotransferase
VDLSTEGMLIIHTLAYALRHNPAQFNLDLDAEGWSSVEQLVNEFRFVRYDWALLDWPRIERTIRGSDRFEVRGGMIRAVYGHSVRLENPPGVAIPPDVLFHGTDADNVAAILTTGLLPMNRQFVHLSSDRDWVNGFVASKKEWAVFHVNAKVALAHGVTFRKANHHVWLADHVTPQYLSIDSTSSVDAVRPTVAVAGHKTPAGAVTTCHCDR